MPRSIRNRDRHYSAVIRASSPVESVVDRSRNARPRPFSHYAHRHVNFLFTMQLRSSILPVTSRTLLSTAQKSETRVTEIIIKSVGRLQTAHSCPPLITGLVAIGEERNSEITTFTILLATHATHFLAAHSPGTTKLPRHASPLISTLRINAPRRTD